MTYDGRQIANFILDFCDTHERNITNLSLQKIMYFCHVWSLVELKRPLIRHKFEAWQFGPVLQYVYREFKSNDSSPITERACELNTSTGQLQISKYDFDSETLGLLKRVVDFYSRLSPSYLVNLSHAEDGPWAKVWNHKGSACPGMKIDDQDIFEYYSRANKDYENNGGHKAH